MLAADDPGSGAPGFAETGMLGVSDSGARDSRYVDGLQSTTVEIVDYDPEWARRFARRATELRQILGDRARLIEHIGSTSVPGLAAKPVVDIVVAVEDPDDEQAYCPDLDAVGYDVRVREPGHRMLRVGEPDEPVNLHCYPPGDVEIRRYLALRDQLRVDADDRALYAATKRQLAQRGRWRDINDYAEAKSAVIWEILGRAGWVEP